MQAIPCMYKEKADIYYIKTGRGKQGENTE